MKLVLITALFTAVAGFAAAEKPAAPSGFHWKTLETVYCDVQVPDGWTTESPDMPLFKAVRILPAASLTGSVTSTGMLISALRCRNQEEWATGMTILGKSMAAMRDAVKNPIESFIKKETDGVTMVVEGVRTMPELGESEMEYHFRAVARAFVPEQTIYIYTFTAPADEWDTAWRKGNVMFNPLMIQLPEVEVPTQSPHPAALSVTPAADAPVVPPPGAADR